MLHNRTSWQSRLAGTGAALTHSLWLSSSSPTTIFLFDSFQQAFPTRICNYGCRCEASFPVPLWMLWWGLRVRTRYLFRNPSTWCLSSGVALEEGIQRKYKRTYIESKHAPVNLQPAFAASWRAAQSDLHVFICRHYAYLWREEPQPRQLLATHIAPA